MATEPDINIGAIAEQLNGKTDTDGGNVQTTFGVGIFNNNAAIPVVQAGTSNGIWYRIYADGWLVQGGQQAATGSYGAATVTFPYEYSSAPNVVTSNVTSTTWFSSAVSTTANSVTDWAGSIADLSTTSFKLNSMSAHQWVAFGFKKSS